MSQQIFSESLGLSRLCMTSNPPFFFFVINSVGICDIYLKLERDSEEKLCLLPIILTLCFPLVISFESQKPEFSHQLTWRFWGHNRPSQYSPWAGGPPRCLHSSPATGRAGGSEPCCSLLQRQRGGLSGIVTNSTKATAHVPIKACLSHAARTPCRHMLAVSTFAHAGCCLHCSITVFPGSFITQRLIRKQQFSTPQKVPLPTWRSEVILNVQLPFVSLPLSSFLK